jgi:hypothetical protein
MPSVSDKQRKMMAIAEHEPDKLYAKNKGVLKMSHQQLHDFAVKRAGTRLKKTFGGKKK